MVVIAFSIPTFFVPVAACKNHQNERPPATKESNTATGVLDLLGAAMFGVDYEWPRSNIQNFETTPSVIMVLGPDKANSTDNGSNRTECGDASCKLFEMVY
jgi:hypothetical protein